MVIRNNKHAFLAVCYQLPTLNNDKNLKFIDLLESSLDKIIPNRPSTIILTRDFNDNSTNTGNSANHPSLLFKASQNYNFSHLICEPTRGNKTLDCIVTDRDVAAAPQTLQLGGAQANFGAQVSLKLLFGYVTIFSSADLFTTDLNCRKKLACDIISECYVILSRRILNSIDVTMPLLRNHHTVEWSGILFGYKYRDNIYTLQSADKVFY